MFQAERTVRAVVWSWGEGMACLHEGWARVRATPGERRGQVVLYRALSAKVKSLHLIFSICSQSTALGPAAAPGTLLEMQNIKPRAKYQAPAQTCWIRNSAWGPAICVLRSLLHDADACLSLRTTVLGNGDTVAVSPRKRHIWCVLERNHI